MKKFYYLDKNLLINGSQHVLLESPIRLSVSDLNDRFGIGRWVEYVGTHLPSGLRYNPSTNVIEILQTGSQRERQHLVALPTIMGKFYGPHNFDPGTLMGKGADTFPNKVLFSQGLDISHGYGIGAYKKDGTPISSILRVTEEGKLILSPGADITAVVEGDLEVGKGVSVGGSLKVKDNIQITGTNPPLDFLSLYKSVKDISASVAGITDLVPLGAICAFMTETLPAGWVLCDGRSLDPEIYRDFIASTGFSRVPDLRGKFIRGWAGSSGYDIGRAIGSLQEDAGREISGTFLLDDLNDVHDNKITGAFAIKEGTTYDATSNAVGNKGRLIDFKASRSYGASHTADEFRPINVSLVYAIKARMPKNKEDADAIRISELLFNLDNKLNHTNPQIVEGSLGVTGNLRARIVKPRTARARTKFIFSGGGDYAEYFKSNEVLSPGDVVSLDIFDNTYKKATYPSHAVGIVSDTNAYTLGPKDSSTYPVALIGRVRANIKEDNYNVTKGSVVALDKLNPGCVDVWDGKFKRDILGIAISFPENGKVMVLVK